MCQSDIQNQPRYLLVFAIFWPYLILMACSLLADSLQRGWAARSPQSWPTFQLLSRPTVAPPPLRVAGTRSTKTLHPTRTLLTRLASRLREVASPRPRHRLRRVNLLRPTCLPSSTCLSHKPYRLCLGRRRDRSQRAFLAGNDLTEL